MNRRGRGGRGGRGVGVKCSRDLGMNEGGADSEKMNERNERRRR